MRLVFLSLLLLPISAQAAPAVVAIGTFFGASAATAFAVGMAVIQVGLTIGMAVYGAAQRRKAERRAKDAYNASLKDRTITRIATEAPHRYVYGRARVGSDIVAMFASGSRDEYKHLVCVHAAHECEAIEEIYINGTALGALDADGFVTGGQFFSTSTEHYGKSTSSKVVVLPYTPVSGTVTVKGDEGVDVAFSLSGTTLTITPEFDSIGYFYSFNYTLTHPKVRVRKHLGAPSDTADASLLSEVPSMWDANKVLRGLCYTVIRLDLNQPEFQGGIPSIEVLLKGKKLYDPRTALTAWSDNNALAIYDYLTSEICGVDSSDLPSAQFITAANVCDEAQSFGKRYTFNGAITSDEDQKSVLERMAQSMAGSIVSTTWDIYAGKYVAPVMALEQSDIVGSLAVNPGVSDADLYNGVRGQYISSETSYVADDFKPFQNSTYLAADGRDLYTNIDFSFTDSLQRVHNLCRIFTEDQRNGYTVKGEFSLKAWKLKVGNRVTLTNSLFGWSSKVFRVTDKKFSPNSAVELTLKEDAASIWDFADAVTADSTPNTNLPNPYAINKLASISCKSGTDALLLNADGAIVSRILSTWPQATTQAVVTNGLIEIEWLALGSDVWQKTQVNGSETQAYLSPVEDGGPYTVRARCVNPYLNVKSDWVYATHTVIGKTEPPPDVAAFSITNGVLSWPAVSALDLEGYRIKFQYGRNTSWANAAPLHVGLVTSSPWQPSLIPPGEVTIMVKAVDLSGNESMNAATIFANFGDPILENLILSYDDKAAGFLGEKTNCSVVSGYLIADDSGDLFWGDGGAQFWGLDSAQFWPASTYKALTYVMRYAVQPDEEGSRLTLDFAIAAGSHNVEYRYDTQGEFWGNDANYFWGVDDAPFWNPPTEWQTWPGAIESIAEGVIEFRITAQAGAVRGIVSALSLSFDVEDEYEEIDDVSILAAGTRLSLTKTYRSIKNIQLTLQDDGGAAVSAKWNDKLATGPLVYCFNNAGTKVAGIVDARIQGVKG